jgi:type VII secretion integral membrane protein EccD
VDDHCRITVVGERRQVDLAVPAGAPITSYISSVTRMCDQEDGPDVLPAVWTLATPAGGAIAPEWSLREVGIADGEILYLRDIAADEFTDPVVHDVGEKVTEVAEGFLDHAWSARRRTVTIMAIGLCWLVAALVALTVRSGNAPGGLVDVSLTLGVALPGLAWVAAERDWPVPPALGTGLALCAVPSLALAASMVFSSDGAAAAVACGALVGSLLAFAAAPGVLTGAVVLAAAVGAVIGLIVGTASAGLTQGAALAAAFVFALLTVVPATVTRLVAFAQRRIDARRPAEENDEALASTVRSANYLLVGWNGTLCSVLSAALVVLCVSPSKAANSEACCVAVALLMRSGSARLAAEVVPVVAAGAAGLFTLTLTAPSHLGWPASASAFLACTAGTGLVVHAFRRLIRRPELPALPRPAWFTGFGSVLGGVAFAMAIGTFGVYGRLVELGQHLL